MFMLRTHESEFTMTSPNKALQPAVAILDANG